MNEPMPAQGAAPQAPESAAQEKSPTDVIAELQQPLSMLNEAVQGSGLPDEAKAHLGNAVSEYDLFMKAAVGGAPQGAPAMGNQSADIAGRKGAVPADQPTGKNVVPA